MIIAPDFLDHWKTRALVDLSKKPEAPLWIVRLWAHCQSRRECQFKLPPIALKSICGVSSDISADDWFKWLKECGFIDGKKADWKVHDWEKYNSSLLSRWANGRQPKAKRNAVPASGDEAEAKRSTSETETRLVSDPTIRVEKSRVEKSRVEREVEAPSAPAPAREGKPSSFAAVEAYIATLEVQVSPTTLAKFYDHFEANGWRTRTGPLRDWHAALRQWIRREREFSPVSKNREVEAGERTADPKLFN